MSGATWALHTATTLDEVNLHLSALQAAGLLGISEEQGHATVYLPDRVEGLGLQGRWERVEAQDWNATWKAGFHPVVVGDVAVVAPWHPPGVTARVTLVIEPAQAFGTGHHETTTTCLRALQDLDLDGATVFDVGTGTGVLALAARALGAKRVLAVDIDPLAVEAAARNAAANDLDIEVAQGSASAAGATQFDVVVANIDTATLAVLAPDLAAAVAPGGRFLGSGVSNERIDEAVTALAAVGLDVRATPGEAWATLTATR